MFSLILGRRMLLINAWSQIWQTAAGNRRLATGFLGYISESLALYGIYLLEAATNQLTSRSRRRQRVRAEGVEWRGVCGAEWHTHRAKDFIKLLFRMRLEICISFFLAAVLLWRGFFSHSFAYIGIWLCADGEQTRMRSQSYSHYLDTRSRRNPQVGGLLAAGARGRKPFEARKCQPQVHL